MLTGGPRAPKKRFDAAMLQGKTATFLLDVSYAGQVFHFSRDTVQVPSTATGESIQYDGGLLDEIAWEEAITLFSTSADVLSLPLQLVLPVDVPSLVQRGHDLLQLTAELSMWVAGTNYEDRRVLLRGRATTPEYGAVGEPVNMSIQSEFFEDRGLIPPAKQTISTTTWPNAATGALGLSYPFVFGQQASGQLPMSPGYLVDTTAGAEVLLIAGGLPGTATSVTVYSTTSMATGAPPGVFTIEQGLDALGQPCQVANLNPLWTVGVEFTVDDDFYIACDQDGGLSTTLGGTDTLTGAGDLLEYLFAQTTLTVDYGRLAVAKPYLNRFKLVGKIVEGITPFEFITTVILPILPCSLVNGPFGLYVVPWQYEAGLDKVVERLDRTVDPTIDPSGPVQYDRGVRDVINEYKLRYALSVITGDMKSALTMSASTSSSDPTRVASLHCAQSQLRYGVRAEEVESTVVYDATTAALVLAWWARAKALPARTVQYLVGYDRAWLERGNVVSITDAELAMTDQLALVDGMVFREDGTILLSLRILDNVAQTFRIAG